MHTVAIVIGAVLFVSAQISWFLATYELMELQHEVNERLPAAEQFEPMFWSFVTRQKFRALQRNILPNSPRPRRARLFTVIGSAFFVLAIGVLYATFRR
jgi:hypothetical protein